MHNKNEISNHTDNKVNQIDFNMNNRRFINIEENLINNNINNKIKSLTDHYNSIDIG